LFKSAMSPKAPISSTSAKTNSSAQALEAFRVAIGGRLRIIHFEQFGILADPPGR
jgi:hypothetical protein